MAPLRIGTRGSELALAQARLVAELLGGESKLVVIATRGDSERSPATEDKSRWVAGLEQALAAREIDLAVHSAKDVPGELADGLELLGAPPRAAAEDVLCWGARAQRARPEPGAVTGSGTVRAGPEELELGARVGLEELEPGARSGLEELEPGARVGLEELEPGARVGTSSIRRAAQLRAVREDLEIVAIRGNVDTRLRKLDDGKLDAIVLARAGLQRLGREDELGAALDPARFVPSPGQGTLALEGRAEDQRARAAVAAIADERAFACLRAERAVAHGLGASCDTPLGAYATDAGCGCLHLCAWVGLPDGSAWVADELVGGFYDPEALGHRMAERLLSAGADALLRRAEELAGGRA